MARDVKFFAVGSEPAPEPTPERIGLEIAPYSNGSGFVIRMQHENGDRVHCQNILTLRVDEQSGKLVVARHAFVNQDYVQTEDDSSRIEVVT